MISGDSQTIRAIGQLVDGYQRQLRFARAAELARGGHYLKAEDLLCPNGVSPTQPEELDLLARMMARQRRYSAAIQYWERALKLDPANRGYSGALDFARERLRQKRIFYPVILGSFIAILVVFVVTLTLYAVFHFAR
jgi:tetratricopeptide (TPR) repeat protein